MAATLSIGDLSEKTGVPPNTIRSWERRYGVPRAHRLDSGHRRYPSGEVERLRLLRRALTLGHRPRRVMRLELDELRQIAASDEARDELTQRDIDDVFASLAPFDPSRFDATLNRAWACRAEPLAFIEHVTLPLLRHMGEQWARGELSIHEEHLISSQLTHFLRDKWASRETMRAARRIVLGLLPGEHHVLGLHMAAMVLAHEGWHPIVFEHPSPPEQLALAALKCGAKAVAISVSHAADLDAVRCDATELREHLPTDVRFIIGSGRDPQVDGARWLSGYDELDAALTRSSAPEE